MRLILQLKHWQLFLIVIGLPLLSDFFVVSESSQADTINVIVGVVIVSTVFSWIWAIGNGLFEQLPAGQRFNLGVFRLAFLSALTILISLLWVAEGGARLTSNDLLVLLFIGVPIYLGLMIYIVLYAARTLKTIELGRLAKIDEYAGEAFLIWMVPVGVWFIQPRLNKLSFGKPS